MKIFAHSSKDIIPVAAALAHTGYLVFLFAIFPIAPWWLLIPLGFIYSVSISWNVNGSPTTSSTTLTSPGRR